MITVVKKYTLLTTKRPEKAMLTKQTNEMAENRKLYTHSLRTVAKRNILQRNDTLESMQQIDHLLSIKDRWERIKINSGEQRSVQLKMSPQRLKQKLKNAACSLRKCT